MSKVIEWIYDHRWAITENSLETIIKIASREMEKGSFDFEAVAAKVDKKLEFTDRVTVRGGVAVIPIIGPIFPRANLFTMISGATAIETLATDFQTTMELEDLHTILFMMDTPGGEITGISEFAKMVFNARGKGKKLIAFGEGMIASAGIWIASATDEIVLADTAEAGSIGVVAAFRDTSVRDEKAGIKKIEIVSSISPLKRAGPETVEGFKHIQDIVDELGDIFVKAVAVNRRVTEEKVRTDFGKGGLLVGESAVAAGLVDRVGSFEEIMDERIESNKSNSNILFISSEGGRRMNVKKDDKGNITAVTDLTVAEVKDGSGDTYKAIADVGKAEGITEGAEAERTRIQSIEEINTPGSEKIVAENKFKPEMTKDKISSLVLVGQEATRNAEAEKLEKDGKETAEKGEGGEKGSTESEQDAVAKAMGEGGNAERKDKVVPSAG